MKEREREKTCNDEDDDVIKPMKSAGRKPLLPPSHPTQIFTGPPKKKEMEKEELELMELVRLVNVHFTLVRREVGE